MDWIAHKTLKGITGKPITTLSESPIHDVLEVGRPTHSHPHSTYTHHIIQLVRLQAAHLKGYQRAVFSSLHDGPVTRMRWAFESNHWVGKRVLLIHVRYSGLVFNHFLYYLRPYLPTIQGTRDPVVPPANSPILKSFLDSAGSNTELVEISGAAHDLTWTHADEVGRALLAFLHKPVAFLDDGA